MKQEQASKTAWGVALIRAIEAAKPVDQRICDDPFARTFINGFSYVMSKLVIDAGVYARMAPGAVEFIIVRERYIDDYLKACLAEGVDQVVILGAGYDTRAYRIAGMEQTRVFEVDQPATQALKRQQLQKVINPLPSHVTFVSIDFNTQSLAERLSEAGYNTHSKTLFIWQGVTYFLTPAGIDNTLAFMAHQSGPGSAIIFDYFYNETLHDPQNRYVKLMRRSAQATGEAYLFGIDQGQIGPFLTQRGFDAVQDMTLDELKQRYFTGTNAGRVMPQGIAIASAKVRI